MTAVEQVAGTMPPRDAAGHEFYGRTVWPWGEDGDIGVMIEGHGRRALAALNAYGRDMDGRHWLSHLAYEARERWVVVHLDCGCTADEHQAKHENGALCSCPRPGLPPCERERYVWTVDFVEPGTQGAVALTEVRW